MTINQRRCPETSRVHISAGKLFEQLFNALCMYSTVWLMIWVTKHERAGYAPYGLMAPSNGMTGMARIESSLASKDQPKMLGLDEESQ